MLMVMSASRLVASRRQAKKTSLALYLSYETLTLKTVALTPSVSHALAPHPVPSPHYILTTPSPSPFCDPV